MQNFFGASGFVMIIQGKVSLAAIEVPHDVFQTVSMQRLRKRSGISLTSQDIARKVFAAGSASEAGALWRLLPADLPDHLCGSPGA